MDMRYDMRGDMRRLPPRNSRGEFTRRGMRRRSRRMDRGMDYGYPEYRETMGRGRDMGSYQEMDGHHYPMQSGRSGNYEPVEFMGYCTGYAGAKGDYGYGMRGRVRDYGEYPYDYGYDDYGDYGEILTDKELEKWKQKLMSHLDEREKQMFGKDIVLQKAKSMGLQMKDFGEKELEVATLMVYTDYKKTIGQNVDLSIKLAYDWLCDDDVAVKGAEKLAVYYDEIVEGGED